MAAASTMINCQPQNVNAARLTNAIDSTWQCLQQPLHRIVDAVSKQRRFPAEREDHRIGMQGPQATVGEPGNVHAELGPDEFCGNHEADQHADDAPSNGHDP